MTLNRRMWVAICCLAIGAAAHWGLQWHMRQAQAQPHPPLKSLVETLPLLLPSKQLTEQEQSTALQWRGIDRPNLEKLQEMLPFQVDGLVSRVYVPTDKSRLAGDSLPVVDLYLVHSRTGEDRHHHPEVCIRDVAGKEEDRSFRKIVYLDEEKKRPAQRFRFKTGSSEYTTVYYWHYTIYPVFDEGQSFLQILHLKRTIPNPSITVQVSTGVRHFRGEIMPP